MTPGGLCTIAMDGMLQPYKIRYHGSGITDLRFRVLVRSALPTMIRILD